MIQRLYPYANGRFILPLLAIILVVNLGIIPWALTVLESTAGPDAAPPDVRLWMTPEDMHKLWSRYDADGRVFYAKLAYTMDLVYPLAYGFFFALLLLSLAGRGNFLKSDLAQTAWVPLAAMVFDLLENTVNATMALSFPSYFGVLPLFSNVLGVVKFAAILISAILVLVFWFRMKRDKSQ